jgi:RecB family exonuclease
MPDAQRDAVSLAGGELRLRGRIDRVDVAGGAAIVYDYKGGDAPEAARWLPDRRFQLALYMLAAAELLGLEPVGGFYQALRGDLRARGVLRADADPDAACVANDRRDDLGELLDGALALALTAARELRGGRLEARPETCSPAGCRYPAICRCAAAVG